MNAFKAQFQKKLLEAHNQYYTKDLGDADCFNSHIGRLHEVIECISGYNLNPSTIHNLLTFYLLNSGDAFEIKEKTIQDTQNVCLVLEALIKNGDPLNFLGGAIYEFVNT